MHNQIEQAFYFKVEDVPVAYGERYDAVFVPTGETVEIFLDEDDAKDFVNHYNNLGLNGVRLLERSGQILDGSVGYVFSNYKV